MAVGGDFVQTVGPVPVIDVPVTNLGEIPDAQREAEAVRIAAAEARRPFDSSNGGPCSAPPWCGWARTIGGCA